MKRYLSIFICLLLLFGITNVPAFAESINSVTASIDGNKLVTVIGTVGGGAGRLVNVRITDPEGDVEYVGSTVSATYGSFMFSYAMTNNAAGRYTVSVSALGVTTPVGAYFDYGTNNSLSALSISNGAFNGAFSPDTTQYSATVDSRVGSLTVTPTASDGTAVIRVNNTVVPSGSPSGPITVNAGNNTISVAVTALNGITKTYAITVTRLSALSATITASASIDANKQVTISGSVSSGAGQLVSVKIAAPNGNTEYAGTVTSGSGGNYRLSYSLSNTQMGRYTVSVGSLGAASPASAYFDYGNDAGLSNLSISVGTLNPTFNPDANSYSADVGGNVNTITVTATARDARATVKVNGWIVASGYPSRSISLHDGANAISVAVTAQDGVTIESYDISIYKTAPLPAGVSVNAQISRDKQVTVSGSISSTAPQATVMITDPTGRLEYLNTSVGADGGVFSFSYTMTNTARGRYYVSVGALGLSSPALTYFIYDPSNADLKNMAISGGTLAPEFLSGNTAYSVSVGYDISSVAVTPTASDPYATIKANGVSVESGSASGSISLNAGSNRIDIIVIAQDGTQKTYTVTVNRDYPPPPPPQNLSDNNYLDDLSLVNEQLDTAFAFFTTDYVARVDNAVDQVFVVPTAQESHATITVNGAPVASGDPSAAIPLIVGDNQISIVVTAQNGATRTYTLNVIRGQPVF